MQKDRWDLSDLFADDAAFEKELKQFSEDMKGVVAFQGKLGESAEKIKEFILFTEDMEKRATNMAVYAHLRYDTDTRDPVSQSMISRVDQVLSQFGALVSFGMPELLSLDEGLLKSVLKLEGMAGHAHSLEDMLRRKQHVLDKDQEKIIAMTGMFSGAASDAYSKLKNADMVYEDAVDSEGKKHKLTNGTYSKYIESKDRELRKDAFRKMHLRHKENINTIASLMESEVKKNIFYAQVRGHKSARHAALFANNVPVEVMDKLIEAVHANMKTVYRLFDLRKKVLDVDELHLYDTYVPLSDVEFDIPYEEGKQIVLDAIKIYGRDYASIVENGLNNNWVDPFEREGKRGGAYSWGTYSSRPYVLMNYSNTLGSVYTLAHELGHSMHSYYSRKTQEYVNSQYCIFVAEVASTCNECILSDYLLKKEKDIERKKFILGNFMDGFKGTVYRQTMFAEFERDIYAHVESGGALTAEWMCKHYMDLVKLYFGPNVVIDEEIQYEWARIPHFYANFYVYQYATGFSAAVALSKQVIDGHPENAFEFLSSGGKDYPINILRNAGIDMESPEVVNSALSVFAGLLDEYEKLI